MSGLRRFVQKFIGGPIEEVAEPSPAQDPDAALRARAACETMAGTALGFGPCVVRTDAPPPPPVIVATKAERASNTRALLESLLPPLTVAALKSRKEKEDDGL